jgi:hypothetical protein
MVVILDGSNLLRSHVLGRPLHHPHAAVGSCPQYVIRVGRLFTAGIHCMSWSDDNVS